MNLLLTGPAGSGKTTHIINEFRESLVRRGMASRIVVPTATLMHHLRNRLAREGLVFRPSSIVTLAQFHDDLGQNFEQATTATFYLIVEEAVRRAGRAEFQKVAETPGFHAALAKTIEEFDAAGCDCDRLARHLPSAPMAAAFLEVWRVVEAELAARQLTTRSKRLAQPVAMAGVERIWMDGFETFSDPELLFIESIAKQAALTVTLPLSRLSEPARSRLRAAGFAERVLESARPSAPAVLVAADNVEREAEEIARRIIGEKSAGWQFREMGVIVRDAAVYRPALEAALERFGIPARFYFSGTLMEHPVGRYLAGLLDALLSGWEHERTLAVLRLAPVLRARRSMDALEFAVRTELPGHGLERLIAKTASDGTLLGILKRFAALDAWRGIKLPGAEWAERVAELADLYGPSPVDGVDWRTAALYRAEARALHAFSSALEEAGKWWRDATPIALDDFWRVAKAVIRMASLDPGDQRRDVVHVLTAYEARQWELPVVFICGLIDGGFPQRHAQNLFFADPAIRQLQQRGIRLRTAAERDEEEEYLFESAAGRATAKLVLSYPRSDAAGEQNLPSNFIAPELLEDRQTCPPVRPELPPSPGQWVPAAAIRSSDLLAELAAKHTRFTPSRLERLVQCPFQFFAGQTLKLEEAPARPEERFDFLLQGNILHKVLAEWFREKPSIEPLFERVFDETCAASRVPAGYRTEVLRERMLRDLLRFAADKAWPQGFESEMERDFEYALDPGLTVKGRIDRVDRMANGAAIVIDYKYSRAQNTKGKIGDETKLQGPLYALAVEESFGWKAAAMVYISLKDEVKVFGWGTVPSLKATLQPLTPEWLANAAGATRRAVAELRAGVILPRPTHLDQCRFCDYRDACRYESAAALAAGERA